MSATNVLEMAATGAQADASWASMYNAFVTALGKSKNFQLITPFSVWNWPVGSLGQTSSQQYSFLDAMPLYSPLGQYQSGSSFSNAYQTWLNTLVVAADPNLTNRITIQGGVLQGVVNQYQTDFISAQAAYKADSSVTANNPDFLTWLNGNGFASGITLAADKANVLEQQKIYNQLVRQAADPIVDAALAAMSNPANNTNVVSSTSPSPIPMPGYGQITSFADWLTQQAGSAPTQITFSNSQSSKSYDSSWAKGEANVSDWFFSAYASGSWQRLSTSEQDSSVTVTLSFNPLGSFSVSANPWYEEAAIRAKVNNPAAYRAGCTPTKPASGQGAWVLGAGGILPCRMTDVVVGYQPSFDVRCAAGFSSSDYQSIQAATGFRIGPFTFGGDGGSSSSYTQNQVSKNGFSGKSTSQFPMIVGVYVEVFS